MGPCAWPESLAYLNFRHLPLCLIVKTAQLFYKQRCLKFFMLEY